MTNDWERLEAVSVIMDTGYIGSADDYCKEYYGSAFSDLSDEQIKLIIKTLKDKKGCLWKGNVLYAEAESSTAQSQDLQ